jgi:hypothetical protein
MKARITREELDTLARFCGLAVQHDCGGFRLIRENRGGNAYVFPASGICPTATKRECWHFLKGFKAGWHRGRLHFQE